MSKFVSQRGDFNRRNASFIDMVQSRMAMSIEVIIKTGGRTPVQFGLMKSEVRFFRNNKGWRVESAKDYSAAQEAGERNGIKFRNYTTAGTGPHWFQHAIDQTLIHKEGFISEAAKANGL